MTYCQLSLKEPILEIRTFKYSIFSIGVILVMISMMTIFTMSPSQTNSLSQLPREAYPHEVAIVNTFQQISAALGSSLFVGIMSASQLKAMNNSVQEQIAIATGFNSATLTAVGFVFVGLCLSFMLGVGKRNDDKNIGNQ